MVVEDDFGQAAGVRDDAGLGEVRGFGRGDAPRLGGGGKQHEVRRSQDGLVASAITRAREAERASVIDEACARNRGVVAPNDGEASVPAHADEVLSAFDSEAGALADGIGGDDAEAEVAGGRWQRAHGGGVGGKHRGPHGGHDGAAWLDGVVLDGGLASGGGGEGHDGGASEGAAFDFVGGVPEAGAAAWLIAEGAGVQEFGGAVGEVEDWQGRLQAAEGLGTENAQDGIEGCGVSGQSGGEKQTAFGSARGEASLDPIGCPAVEQARGAVGPAGGVAKAISETGVERPASTDGSVRLRTVNRDELDGINQWPQGVNERIGDSRKNTRIEPITRGDDAESKAARGNLSHETRVHIVKLTPIVFQPSHAPRPVGTGRAGSARKGLTAA